MTSQLTLNHMSMLLNMKMSLAVKVVHVLDCHHWMSYPVPVAIKFLGAISKLTLDGYLCSCDVLNKHEYKKLMIEGHCVMLLKNKKKHKETKT